MYNTCGDMIPQTQVPDRVYECAKKYHLLTGDKFSIPDIFAKLEKMPNYDVLPKYFTEFISYDGESFPSLAEFPQGVVYRVCRGNATFPVGALVWRDTALMNGLDGINFVQEAACLDDEFCDEALQGVMFDATTRQYRKYKGR